MARIARKGLDYFPTDINFLQTREMKRLSRKFGAIAPVIIMGVYAITYGEEGYYMPWNEDICFDLSELANTGTKEVHAVLQDAIIIGYFDAEMFKEHQILTSKSIQKQYLQCTIKRKKVVLEEKYRLVEETSPQPSPKERGQEPGEENSGSSNGINVPQNLFSGEEMDEKEGGMQQSKAKQTESIVKQRESTAKQTSPLAPSQNGGDDDPKIPQEGVMEEDKVMINGRRVPKRCLNKRTHNYDGLLDRLTQIHVTEVKEVNKILEMSDYGRIGHPLWGIISYNNWRANTIKWPGKYILSQLKQLG